jgi:hypothetical protein
MSAAEAMGDTELLVDSGLKGRRLKTGNGGRIFPAGLRVRFGSRDFVLKMREKNSK